MPQCTATSKRSGEQCMRLATPGTNVCSMHGSKIPNVRKAALRRLAREQLERQVWKLVDELDLPDDVGDDPGEVLSAARRRAETMASLLWVVVQQLGVASEVEISFSPDERVIRSLAGGSGTSKTMAALFGPDHLGDGAPHVAVEMFREWNAQAAKLAKLELDAGIEERRTRISEEQAQVMSGVLRTLVDGLLELALSQLVDDADRRAVRAAWSSTAGPLARHAIMTVAIDREPGERPTFPVRVVEAGDDDRAESAAAEEAAPTVRPPVIPPASDPLASSADPPPPPTPPTERQRISGVPVADDEDIEVFERQLDAEAARRALAAEDEERRRGMWR